MWELIKAARWDQAYQILMAGSPSLLTLLAAFNGFLLIVAVWRRVRQRTNNPFRYDATPLFFSLGNSAILLQDSWMPQFMYILRKYGF